MKALLNYRDQRILKICEMLVLSDVPLSYEEIMMENGSSLKTTYDDVLYLEHTWGALLNIRISNGAVYSSSPSIADLMYIKRSIYKNIISLQIGLHIYFNGPQKLTELIEMMHCSESKIRKEIIKLNKVLKDNDIKIELREGKYAIKAQSQYVLAYLVSLTIIASGYPEAIYKNREQLMALSTIEKITNFKLPAVIRNELLLADALVNRHAHENDALTFCSPLPKQVLEDIHSIAKEFIDDYEAVKDTVVSIFQTLHFKVSIFKKNMFYMHRYHYFYYLFSEENREFIKLYEKYLKVLESRWHLSFYAYKEELMFLLYTNLPTVRRYKSAHIAVHSDMGKDHAEILIGRFKKHFHNHQFSIYDDLGTYDFVISTSKHSSNIKRNDLVVLEISDFANKNDMFNLYNFIYNKD